MTRSQIVVLTVLAVVQFTHIVDFMIVMPMGELLMASLRIDPGRFGLIVSSYTFAACVASLAAASVIDRFDRKTAYLFLYVGFLVGTLACGLVPDYVSLLAARIVTGAFGGILGGLSLAIIADVFPPHLRGRANGALISGFAVAAVVGIPLGLLLSDRLGWQMPFRVLAVLGLPVLGLAVWGLPRLPPHIHAGAPTSGLRRLFETIREPNHLRAFALMIAVMFGGFAIIPYFGPYLVANVGITQDRLALVYVVGGTLTFVGSPLVGRLSDRYGPLPIFRVMASCSAILILVLTNLPPVPVALAVIPVGLMMTANAGRMVAALSILTSSVVPERRGSFLSVNASVQHFSTGLGAYVAGLMIGRTPDGQLSHYPLVGLMAVAVTVVSLWLAGRVRKAETASPGVALDSGCSLRSLV